MPRSDGSDVDDALPLEAPVPFDFVPDVEGPVAVLPEVEVPLPLDTEPEAPLLDLSLVALPDPLAPPEVDEPMLGVAVDELLPGLVEVSELLLPGMVDVPVPGEALGLPLTLA
jgi:hypothetical protein